MPDSAIAAELAALQSQLETLENHRRSDTSAAGQTAGKSTTSETTEAPPEWLASWLDANGELDLESILDALRNSGHEWLEGFNQDLAEAKPSSILAVFAMGFLLGKLS